MYDEGMDGMNGRWMVDIARVFCLLVLYSFAMMSYTFATDCQTFDLPNSKSASPTRMSLETTMCPGCNHIFFTPRLSTPSSSHTGPSLLGRFRQTQESK